MIITSLGASAKSRAATRPSPSQRDKARAPLFSIHSPIPPAFRFSSWRERGPRFKARLAARRPVIQKGGTLIYYLTVNSDLTSYIRTYVQLKMYIHVYTFNIQLKMYIHTYIHN